MSRLLKRTMIIIAAIITLFIMVSLVASNSTLDSKNNNFNNIYQAVPTASSEVYDLFTDIGVDAYGSWEFETIDTYNWTQNSDSYYLGLNTDSVTRYSLTLSINSPVCNLNKAHGNYTFSMDYFSNRVDESLAGKIEVLATNDGENYYLLDTVNRVWDNNSGLYNNFSIDICNCVKQIKIRAKVLYGCDIDKGISVKNMQILPKSQLNLEVPNFTTTIADSDFIANSTKQTPEFEVVCDNWDYQYDVITQVYKEGILTDSIGKGTYMMYVIIFSPDSKIVDITKKQFTITPINIDHFIIEYYANDLACLIRDIKVFDFDDNDVSALVGEIGCVINGMGNDRMLKITVHSSENNEIFIQSGITIPNKDTHVVNMAAKQEYTYTGLPIDIISTDTASSVITYDYSTTTGETYENSTPTDVGSYLVSMNSDGILISTATVIITPKEITNITYNFPQISKNFDGTYELNNVNKNDFTFEGLVENDTSILLDGLYLDRLDGVANVISDKVDLGNNYIYNPSTNFNLSCKINRVNITLSSNIDENIVGEDKHIIRANEREYNGDINASINLDRVHANYNSIEEAPLIWAGNDPSDIIFANTINMEYLDQYAGVDKELKISFNDPILNDRYLPFIITNAPLSKVVGDINPKQIEVDLGNSDILAEDKVYDGTIDAQVIINSFVFTGILPADTLDNYILSYSSSLFSDSNVGIDKNITISDIVLSPKNIQNESLLNSYKVKDITTGIVSDITKANIIILDESYNIKTDGAIPIAKTNPSNVVIEFRYYYYSDDATNNISVISDFATNASGVYYIRAEVFSSEINYKLESGYKIIPLTISANKYDQIIMSGITMDYYYHNAEGDYYKMVVGGQYVLTAYSITNSKQNGMVISSDLEQVAPILTRDATTNVFTARQVGESTIVLRQDGNADYNQATPYTIKIVVVNEVLSAFDIALSGDLYYGQVTPSITGKVLFGDDEVVGQFTEDNSMLEVGSKVYNYKFNASQKYLGKYNVLVPLVTNKATIKILLSDIDKVYYSDIDWGVFANVSISRGNIATPLTKNEADNLAIVYNYNVDYKSYVCGNYIIKLRGLESDTDILTLEEKDNYLLEFSNVSDTINLNVTKSEITLTLPVQNKFYGQDVANIAEIKNNIVVNGSFDATNDQTELNNAIDLFIQINKYSMIGSYPIGLGLNDTTALDDKYNISLENSVYYINPTVVNVVANEIGHTYGHEVTTFTFRFEGFYLESDKAIIRENIIANCDVNSYSSVGDYVITMNYFGSDDRYIVNVVNGHYIVNAATLNGFTMNDMVLLYDNKPHSIIVNYDENIWSELDISYSALDLLEPGKYIIVAQIVKENYMPLNLTAMLTIKAKQINTTNRVNDGQLILPSDVTVGFDPNTVLRIERNINTEVETHYNSILENTDTEQELIWGIYDFYAFCDDSVVGIPSDIYYLRFKIDGINSIDGIKIFALDENGMPVELIYAFSEGYFTIGVNNFSQIAIVNTTTKMIRDTGNLVFAIVIGTILLILMFIIFFSGLKKIKHQEARSRKRHSRWA